MKLKEAREHYYILSGKTSDIVRQLGFAGLAVIWIFRTDKIGERMIPNDLIPAAILIIVALSADLFHYCSATLLWGCYHRRKEKEGATEEDEFTAPKQMNWPALFFFWLKIMLMILAYTYLLRFLWNTLN